MSNKVFVDNLTDILWEEVNPLKILKNYIIEIGVWDTTFDREILEETNENGKKKLKLIEPSVEVGVSNAQLMYIHEYGTSTIPERPVLQLTVDWGYKRLDEYYLNEIINGVLNHSWEQEEVEKCLKQLAAEMEAYCKKMTQQNKFGLTPLSEKTIEQRRKHSNVPLYDTGQLIKSIRCRVTKL